MVKIWLPCWLILTFALAPAFAQRENDFYLDFILKKNVPQVSTGMSSAAPRVSDISEFKMAIVLLTRFYQTAISSQDKASCNFSLSCSRFSQAAILRYGILYGLLMTSDRLQRCNSLGRQYYPLDSNSGLAIDAPLQKYYLGYRKK